MTFIPKILNLYTASLPILFIKPVPFYRSRVPARAKKQAMPVTTKGALSTGPAKVKPAALLLLLAEGEEVDEAEPGSASPTLASSPPPAVWEPGPSRPGPVPAPLAKYWRIY
jgi:hypothetical protein